MVEKTFQSPSQIFNLSEVTHRVMRRDGTLPPFRWNGRLTTINEWWINYQFDNAIITFGRWVESMLSKTDDKGKQLYELDSLVNDPDTRPRTSGSGHRVIALEGAEIEDIEDGDLE